MAIEQSPPDHVFSLSTGIPSSGDRLRGVSGHQEASMPSTLARDWRREAHEGMEQLRKGQAVSTNRIITTLPMKGSLNFELVNVRNLFLHLPSFSFSALELAIPG